MTATKETYYSVKPDEKKWNKYLRDVTTGELVWSRAGTLVSGSKETITEHYLGKKKISNISNEQLSYIYTEILHDILSNQCVIVHLCDIDHGPGLQIFDSAICKNYNDYHINVKQIITNKGEEGIDLTLFDKEEEMSLIGNYANDFSLCINTEMKLPDIKGEHPFDIITRLLRVTRF